MFEKKGTLRLATSYRQVIVLNCLDSSHDLVASCAIVEEFITEPPCTSLQSGFLAWKVGMITASTW